MFYDFQIEYTRTYSILRDYLVKTDEYEGIRLVLCDKQSKEIVTKFILIEDIGSDGEWKKTKTSKQADYVRIVVSEGNEDMMIEEVGKVKRKGMFDKEMKVDVKQYTYTFKKRS